MEKIKLPRSSYEELTKIITAYGALNKPSGLSDIVQASGVHKTVVSANNAFLTFIEIIEGGNKKSITPKGIALARALQHQMQSEKKSAWKDIIDENDFLTKMVQAVKIRRGMETGQFENHIAFSSGETKSTGVKTGARAVVDIFLDSGVLIQDGDKIIFDNDNSNYEHTQNISPELQPKERKHVEVERKIHIPQVEVNSGVTINIELSINAKPDELDGLGKKIKKIIDELSEEE